MTPDLFVTHPDLVMFAGALLANLFIAGLLYGASETSSRHWTSLITWWTRTFTDDPYPQTADSIARAKHYNAVERRRENVDADGQVRRLRGLSEIHRGTADNMLPFARTTRRRQELDATVDTVTTLTRERIH